MIGLLLLPLLYLPAALWLPSASLFPSALIFGSGVLALSLDLARLTLQGPLTLAGGALYLDGFGALVLLSVAFLIFQSAWQGKAYLDELNAPPQIARRYWILWGFFGLSMLATPLLANLALYWGLIELTTLSSALLVAFEESPEALEGAWKYVVVVSVGVSLAFLATLFLYAARGHLSWPLLLRNAASLHRPWVLLAFFLATLGYGTKVGLVPMHTWLPDAHSVAPSPISAMLSGALLNTALLGLVRFWQIARASLGAHWPDQTLLLFGLLSLAVAALSLGVQRKTKRLLAYSSIEHMGLITLALGLSAPYLAFLQMINHTVVKSSLFLAAGNLVHRLGETLSEASGVLFRMPITGISLLLGGWAITGAPPLNLFPSEFGILQRAFYQSPWLGALLALLLLIVFLLFIGRWSQLLFPKSSPPPREHEAPWTSLVPLVLGLGLLVWLSLMTPLPLQLLLRGLHAH
jgi:hydrogenase-4 component F